MDAIALQNPTLKKKNQKIKNISKKENGNYYMFELAYQLKEASVAEASATPPTTGTSEATIQGVGICQKNVCKNCRKSIKKTVKQSNEDRVLTSPRNIADKTTEKNGSIALIV